MEKARGNGLPDQRDTTNLWPAWAHKSFLGLLFPFALLLKLERCLTRSIHSGSEGKVLKVSFNAFYYSLYGLGCCHGYFFQNNKLGLSPSFHTGEEIREQGALHPEESYESKIFLASTLIYFLLCRAKLPYIPDFSLQCLGLYHSWAGWIEPHPSPECGWKLLGIK